jgi:hypothetical protein
LRSANVEGGVLSGGGEDDSVLSILEKGREQARRSSKAEFVQFVDQALSPKAIEGLGKVKLKEDSWVLGRVVEAVVDVMGDAQESVDCGVVFSVGELLRG